MVSLLVSKLKLDERSQKRSEKIQLATERRRLLASDNIPNEHFTTEENFVLQKTPKKFLKSHSHLKKFNDHLERILETQDSFIESKHTHNEPTDSKRLSTHDKSLYFKEQHTELGKMSHENAERTHPTGVPGHANRKLKKATRQECENSLKSAINSYNMKEYKNEFRNNSADAASILTSFVTSVDGCNDILKDDSDIESKLISLKVKIPDFTQCKNTNEKIEVWKVALIQPMLTADAYKTFLKTKKQEEKDSRRLVDAFALEKSKKLNKHLFDDLSAFNNTHAQGITLWAK